MKPSEAAELAQMIAAAYPAQRQRMGESDARGFYAAYAACLADLDLAVGRGAVNRAIKTSKFIPTIADIRVEAVELGGAAKAGGEAWGECQALIRRYGSHRTPGMDFQIDDTLLARAIKAIGWKQLCSGDNPEADRAQFIKLYDQLAARERKEAAIAPGATKALVEGVAQRLLS